MTARLLLLLLLLVPGAGAVQGSETDPLEPINRPIFAFNDMVDTFVLRPAARGYDYVMPQSLQRGIGNFLGNMVDVNRAVNSLLQGRWEGAYDSAGRVVINSTLGMFGFFDVATPLGVERHRADFGETLAAWGLPQGPYVVVPLFGPRTVRSGTGTIVDTLASVPFYVDDSAVTWSLFSVGLVHARARLLESDQLMSGDRYIFVRDAYLQQRAARLREGILRDEFSDFEDDWSEDF
jgi:phospholipid-binding lipoprotein MlaA